MKKILLILIILNIANSAEPFSILNTNNIFETLFDEFNANSSGLANICYRPDFSNDALDPCSLLTKVDGLNMDICSIAPNIPGFKPKTKELGFRGLTAMCKAKNKKFIQPSSQANTDAQTGNVDYSDNESLNKKLPNGMSMKDYLLSWNINESLKKEKNYIYEIVIKNKNSPFGGNIQSFKEDQEILFMIQDLQASKERKNSIQDIQPSDFKAPQNMLEYKQERDDYAKQFNIIQKAKITELSKSIEASLHNKKLQGNEATTEANRITVEAIKEVELQKAVEIEQSIRASRRDTDMAFPTQEIVDIMSQDMQPKYVAKIRNQIQHEASIIAKINKKYDKYNETLHLIAEKAVIMNEKFDKDKAREEIEKILEKIQ